jgi:ribosomal protein S18 acetylase RimI-like enzyme
MVSFRVASEGDVAAIVSLVESAYRGDSSRAGWTTEAHLLDGQRTDADAVRATIGSVDRLVLLAHDQTVLVGCCELRRLPGRTAYFGMFAVIPTLQGGGIGKLVLAEAERHAREHWDASHMEMTVLIQREELIGWYERRGYRRTGRTEPFPYGDVRFGLPRQADLMFEVLEKTL